MANGNQTEVFVSQPGGTGSIDSIPSIKVMENPSFTERTKRNGGGTSHKISKIKKASRDNHSRNT